MVFLIVLVFGAILSASSASDSQFVTTPGGWGIEFGSVFTELLDEVEGVQSLGRATRRVLLDAFDLDQELADGDKFTATQDLDLIKDVACDSLKFYVTEDADYKRLAESLKAFCYSPFIADSVDGILYQIEVAMEAFYTLWKDLFAVVPFNMNFSPFFKDPLSRIHSQFPLRTLSLEELLKPNEKLERLFRFEEIKNDPKHWFHPAHAKQRKTHLISVFKFNMDIALETLGAMCAKKSQIRNSQYQYDIIMPSYRRDIEFITSGKYSLPPPNDRERCAELTAFNRRGAMTRQMFDFAPETRGRFLAKYIEKILRSNNMVQVDGPEGLRSYSGIPSLFTKYFNYDVIWNPAAERSRPNIIRDSSNVIAVKKKSTLDDRNPKLQPIFSISY